MSWKKILLSFILVFLIIQLGLIGDIYLSADKSMKLEKVSKEKYKANLILRSFYIYDNFSKEYPHDETKTFSIESFPENSFGDGVNYGNNIGGLPSWALFRSEELNLDSNSIVIPYDYTIFLIFRQTKEIIAKVIRDDNNEPISITYTIQDRE